MRVVHEAIRKEREDEPGEKRGRHTSGQRSHEQKHRRAREREARQKNQVVGEQLRNASPDERRSDERGHDHRVRERQRPALRMEDVPVEQIERIPRQLVGHPCQPPGGEERVAFVAGDRAPQLLHLRIRHDRGQRHEERNDRKHPGRAHDESAAVAVQVLWSRTRRKVLGQGAGGTRSGTYSPANRAESRKDAAVQRRVAYKNVTREQENTRPEEGAPFRSDRDPLAAQHEYEATLDRDKYSQKQQRNRTRIRRVCPPRQGRPTQRHPPCKARCRPCEPALQFDCILHGCNPDVRFGSYRRFI